MNPAGGTRLAGKVAVVTGAGRGIGRIEAKLLAEHGACIVVGDIGVNDRGDSTAELVAAEIRQAGGQAVAATEDLMQPQGAKRTIDIAIESFGGVDILVNNAGLRGGNPIDELTEEQWDRVLDSHLKSAFLMTKYAVPLMQKRGGGSIVNTGSEAGLGMVFNAAYAAAKEGLAGLSRSVAREQGRFNIRCNLIRPRANVDTGGGDWVQQNLRGKWKPLLDALGPSWIGERGEVGFNTVIPAEPIAAFTVWLCTSAAAHLNGQDFYVGGEEFAFICQPAFTRTSFHQGGWTVEAFDRRASAVTAGLSNRFLIPDPLGN